jgi:large subunit ribosomal protein L9
MRKSGEGGHLFGSVTSADIAAELAAQGHEVDRRKIQLGDPIKAVGDFKVAVRLHREVTARVTVKVQAEVTEEDKAAAANAASAGAASAEETAEPVAEEATAE